MGLFLAGLATGFFTPITFAFGLLLLSRCFISLL
jgi:hypothetical protein